MITAAALSVAVLNYAATRIDLMPVGLLGQAGVEDLLVHHKANTVLGAKRVAVRYARQVLPVIEAAERSSGTRSAELDYDFMEQVAAYDEMAKYDRKRA